jgi:hypothetical protein
MGDCVAVATALPAPYPASIAAEAGEDDAVATVVAKVFVCRTQGSALKMGFPAFDFADRLVGFYEEGPGESSAAALRFRPLALAARLGYVGVGTGGGASVSLAAERARGSKSVVSRAAHGGELQGTKDAAVAYFWAKGGEPDTTDLGPASWVFEI